MSVEVKWHPHQHQSSVTADECTWELQWKRSRSVNISDRSTNARWFERVCKLQWTNVPDNCVSQRPKLSPALQLQQQQLQLEFSRVIRGLPELCPPLSFRVRAYCPVGAGSYSEHSQYITPSDIKPSKMDRVQHGDITDAAIHVMWKPPSCGANVDAYQMHARCGMGDFSPTYSGDQLEYWLGLDPRDRGCDVDNKSELLPDTKYVIRIRAVNAQGVGEWSDSAIFATSIKSTPETNNNNNGVVNGGSSPASSAQRILSNWLSAAHQASSSGSSRTSSAAAAGSSWDMPTEPTRICDLPSGWVVCWSPQHQRIYYWNPITDHVTWNESEAGVAIDSNRHINYNCGDGGGGGGGGSSAALTQRPALPSPDTPFLQKRVIFLMHVRGSPGTGPCRYNHCLLRDDDDEFVVVVVSGILHYESDGVICYWTQCEGSTNSSHVNYCINRRSSMLAKLVSTAVD